MQSENAITPEVRYVDSRSHLGGAFPQRRFRIGRLKYATTRPGDLLTGGIAEFQGTAFGGMYPVRDRSDYKLPSNRTSRAFGGVKGTYQHQSGLLESTVLIVALFKARYPKVNEDIVSS
jgi:hypothetical protein